VRSLALALLLVPAIAQATTTPAVAVMPFKDLSGSKGSIGEAIRETVTTDLKDVPGLRVIERGNIDKILAEQNLQARKADLDPLSTVKVGKLLGASLIVAGAYQKAAANVRLTARFVQVETGEIIGSAKVDGHASDFLTLQDKVTTELLKSAGIEQKSVQLFAKRTRPKLKSLKPVELYGDAVVEKDDAKKRDILQQAVNEDPSFIYASRDLDELEKRLKQYDTAYQRETERALKELKAQVQNEKDPQKLMIAYTQMFAKLQLQRKWRTLMALSRDVVKSPPPPTQYFDVAEYAQMNLVQCHQALRDYDGVLREGEKFVAKYPNSNSFTSVRALIDQAIDKKREREEGVKKAQAEIAAMSPEQRADRCSVGQKYQTNAQPKKARVELEACLAGGKSKFPPGIILQLLITSALEEGDFAGARKYLEKLHTVDAQAWKSMSALEQTMPSDG
jgi:TolB-like protein